MKSFTKNEKEEGYTCELEDLTTHVYENAAKWAEAVKAFAETAAKAKEAVDDKNKDKTEENGDGGKKNEEADPNAGKNEE